MPFLASLLTPPPLRFKRLSGVLRLPPVAALHIQSPGGIENRLDVVVARLRRLLRSLGVRRISSWRAAAAPTVAVMIDAMRHPRPQSYELAILPTSLVVAAGSAHGAWNALMTLEQIVALGEGRVPCADIADAPALPVRGFMLDISRDKVPTMASLRELIELLASLKFNQLQLYIEHTFAYRRRRVVWRDASPLTPAEVRTLDRWCRRHFIELVPNQNCLGHMDRWLRHPPYAPLAEATGPWRSPFGDVRTTRATLCPTDPRSFRLVRSLLDELLPHFESRRVNVGCDEPFELGQGRSAAACRRRGKAAVFVDYVRGLHAHLRRRGRRMLMWADVVAQHPASLARLPRDIILLEWGYEAGHPFDRRGRAYARAGHEVWFCPGTSSWCSFSGRTRNALANIREAALAARRVGAAGLLLTDWGDYGHRQYWPVSLPHIVFAAAAAWNPSAVTGLDLPRVASRWAFGDRTGRAASFWLDLGSVHDASGVRLPNQTVLFRVMRSRLDDSAAVDGLSVGAVARMQRRLDALGSRLRRAAPHMPPLVTREAAATQRVLRHACRRARLMLRFRRDRAALAECRRLAADMRAILREHRRLWLARNRPGGLKDSLAHLSTIEREYRSVLRG